MSNVPEGIDNANKVSVMPDFNDAAKLGIGIVWHPCWF